MSTGIGVGAACGGGVVGIGGGASKTVILEGVV